MFVCVCMCMSVYICMCVRICMRECLCMVAYTYANLIHLYVCVHAQVINTNLSFHSLVVHHVNIKDLFKFILQAYCCLNV